MNTQPSSHQNIVILGSTGSVGSNAVSVLDNATFSHDVIGLGAGRNWEKLSGQIQKFAPNCAGVRNQTVKQNLIQSLEDQSPELLNQLEIFTGEEAIRTLASTKNADTVLCAISGSDGLSGTIEAIRNHTKVALANKESMVVGGPVINEMLPNYQSEIIPVDSEHSSIFQLLEKCGRDRVQKILITASGGPFWNRSRDEMADATPEEAMNHPNWDMGRKISIDSATMMNKALEVVEAHYLFDLPADRIEVLVHPQSLVHAMVRLNDGSLIAHMGEADMKLPIQYAFTHPDRSGDTVSNLDLSDVDKMTFESPDHDRFPALSLGYETIRKGGTMGAVMNAANEEAVDQFVDRNLAFLEIPRVVQTVMNQHDVTQNPSLDQIQSADEEARKQARDLVNQNRNRTVRHSH